MPLNTETNLYRFVVAFGFSYCILILILGFRLWVRRCLVYVFKQQFLVFKQHFTYFNAFFYPHVFSQIFLNNNFQFLNRHTKQTHKLYLKRHDICASWCLSYLNIYLCTSHSSIVSKYFPFQLLQQHNIFLLYFKNWYIGFVNPMY